MISVFFFYSERIFDNSRFYNDLKRHFRSTLIILYVSEKLQTIHTVPFFVDIFVLKSSFFEFLGIFQGNHKKAKKQIDTEQSPRRYSL